MRGFWRGAFALAGGLVLSVAQAQPIGISVSPVQLDLGAGRTSTSLTLSNSTDRPHRFQVEIVRWTQDPDGSDVYLPTADDLLANPPLFELAAGATQVVRIGLRVPPPEQVAHSYRVYLSEVPTGIRVDAEDSAGSAVQVLLRMGVPLFVAPRQPVRYDLRWSATRDADGLLLTAANHGNVRERRTRVSVSRADGGGVLHTQDSYRDILPGARWTLRVPLGTPAPSAVAIESITQNDKTERSVVPVGTAQATVR